jgi:hypothetical protein
MGPAGASASCPRCGAETPGGAPRCPRCGFAFFESAERRPLPRPSGRVVTLAAAGLVAAGAVVAGAVAVVSGGEDQRAPTLPVSDRDFPRRLPSPVPALEAERRLERRYGDPSDDESAAVRCPRRIEPDRTIRCELRYRDGVPRALLVRLSPRGELEADVPYPATLRR